jgi:hypothetical protein
VHPGLVPRAELHVDNGPGQLRRHQAALIVKNARQDGDPTRGVSSFCLRG